MKSKNPCDRYVTRRSNAWERLLYMAASGPGRLRCSRSRPDSTISPSLKVNNIVRSTQALHKAEMSSESWPPQLKYVLPAISSHPRNSTEILNLPHPCVGNG